MFTSPYYVKWNDWKNYWAQKTFIIFSMFFLCTFLWFKKYFDMCFDNLTMFYASHHHYHTSHMVSTHVCFCKHVLNDMKFLKTISRLIIQKKLIKQWLKKCTCKWYYFWNPHLTFCCNNIKKIQQNWIKIYECLQDTCKISVDHYYKIVYIIWINEIK